MKITESIAQHITEVHEGGNWTDVNIKDALADVSFKEAATVTKASNNTIAALVLKANGQHTEEQIIGWVLACCFDGLAARA